MRTQSKQLFSLIVLTLWLVADHSIQSVWGTEKKPELTPGSSILMADRPMKNVDGNSVTLSSVKGTHGTVVAFWCNHCPYVKAYEGRMLELATIYQEKGFGFIAVNSNEPARGDDFESMQAIAKEKNYSFPYVLDDKSEMASAYGASKTPHIYLFDAKDTLVYVGAIDDNSENPEKVTEPFLRNALDALIDGAPILKKQTKAIGCTIKWQE